MIIVQLPARRVNAPIELTRVGKWLEHVPELRLNGERPSSRALVARMASFWLPDQTILYIGSTEASIGGRIGAMAATVLGERRPHSAGYWLKALTSLPTTKVWWATTDAPDETEDALLDLFAEGLTDADRAALPTGALALPWATLRRPTGERRETGISHPLVAAEPEPAAPPPTRIVVLPDGDAEGADGSPPPPKPKVRAIPAPKPIRAPAAASRPPVAPSTTTLTPDGAARLQAELDELTKVRRPEVIARIRTAKEHGDLKENAEYAAAREEQSFLEGRVQALEARLRDAIVVAAPSAGASADIGSIVAVEIDGERETYTLVGSSEADISAGRMSIASPVGRALVGSRPGMEVVVVTPRGPVSYRVVAVD